MKNNTKLKLNDINSQFYQKYGEYFSDSRQYFWDGWKHTSFFSEIENLFTHKDKINVLDVGCGNGRFFEFLNGKFENKFDYIGIDSSEILLNIAKEKFETQNSKFKFFDILNESNWTDKFNNLFDLIVCFGVVHHIPSVENLGQILKEMKNLTTDDGLITLSVWQFFNDEKLRSKILDKNDPFLHRFLQKFNLSTLDLGENGFIMDFKRSNQEDEVRGFRFCRKYTQEEILFTIKKIELKMIESYNADGKSGDLNKYFLLKK